jgi:hypothetical protein
VEGDPPGDAGGIGAFRAVVTFVTQKHPQDVGVAQGEIDPAAEGKGGQEVASRVVESRIDFDLRPDRQIPVQDQQQKIPGIEVITSRRAFLREKVLEVALYPRFEIDLRIAEVYLG